MNIGSPVERPGCEVTDSILKLSGSAGNPLSTTFDYISVLWNAAQIVQRITVRDTALVGFVLESLMLGPSR